MSNIDNELAFGSYVSIPIRTEKTAEQKWNSLKDYLTIHRDYLAEATEIAHAVNDMQGKWINYTLMKEVEGLLCMMDERDANVCFAQFRGAFEVEVERYWDVNGSLQVVIHT